LRISATSCINQQVRDDGITASFKNKQNGTNFALMREFIEHASIGKPINDSATDHNKSNNNFRDRAT